MAHSIRNAATSVMEWFQSTGSGTPADPFIVSNAMLDENNDPLGPIANPIFVHTSPRLADTLSHKTYNMFGENASVTAVATGDDMWLGTTTTLPFPNQSVGEQMVIKSDDPTDIGNPEGTMTSATHATNLDDTTALWQTRAVAAGDIILNVTDGSSTTVASITSETALITNALTGGTLNTWTLNDVYHVYGGGAGAHIVDIHYLDSSNVEQIERLVLNGTAGVNTVATDITFINDMHTVEVDATAVAAGNIIVHKLGDATTIYDMIGTGGNKSLTCQMKVPAGKTYFIKGWTASVASGAANKPAAIRLRSTNYEDTLYPGVFLFKDTFYLESGGIARKFDEAIRIPSLAVVKVSIWTGTSGAGAAASFEGVLVDNTLIP